MENTKRTTHKICGKSLAVILTATMVVSVATASSVSVSASYYLQHSNIAEHTVGVIGNFAECEKWTKDIPMKDGDGDGIYEAWITGQEAGDYEFKVRLDDSWDNSWGEYEAENDRIHTSQVNCEVTVNSESDVIKVTFDTTSVSEQALAQSDSYAHYISDIEDPNAFIYWPVSYEVFDQGFEYDVTDDGIIITNYYGMDTEVTIPSEICGKPVIGIEEFAFYKNKNNNNIKSITIPASVIKIGVVYCDIENINVDKDNPVYSSKGGVLFSKDGTKLLLWPRGKEVTSSLLDDALDNVKEIGDHAFFDNENFEVSTLIIPDSVEIIGECAFGFLGHSIENLILGKNVQSIGEVAFGNTYVKEVTFPENISFIGDSAFETALNQWTSKNTTFNGYTGSYAELYCKAYGYKFVSIGTAAEKPELTNSEFGIKVKGSFPDGATLAVEEATSKLIPDAVFCYNITLNKDGETVQPTGFVTVSIPCDIENCRVFYEDFENNTLVDMNAIYLDGCYVFATNHFSDYIIVPYDTEISVDIIQPSFEITNSSVTPDNSDNNDNTGNSNTDDNNDNTDNNNNNTDNNNNNTGNSNTDNNNDNTDNNNNNTGNSDTNNNTDNNNNNTTNNNDTPATGENGMYVFMAAIFVAISGITAVILSKTKRRKNEQ